MDTQQQAVPTLTLVSEQGNAMPTLDTLQQFLAPHIQDLISFWWFVWIMTAFALIRFVYVHGVRTDEPTAKK